MSYQSGFFISCFKGREKQAYREFLKITHPHITSEHQTATTNFNQALEDELKQKGPFSQLFIKDLKNVVFVKLRCDDDVVVIYESMRSLGVSTKYIQRLIPIQHFFDIVHYERELADFIKGISESSFTYKIVCEARLCDGAVKVNVFDCVARLMERQVSLTNPDYVFVVQICKNVVGVVLIKNEKANFNFNNKDLRSKNINQ
ncbi:hypothetical protein COBT_000908 [Conglomerata obtusa]